ncbi:hypothetical protein ACO22_05947 [Paracoccidioides brasiliensis]|uniref:DUF676 domain-containing protein n=1 Tax=Paracoccidioides brasiliensis TaxID=121759 RepID=A0A1D2J8V3_PARBR|nr:hypothetical protein ACO22_05947 [Paracoccidioides brasiliensis]
MLVTPRVYQLSQLPNNGSHASSSYHPNFHSLTSWDVGPAEYKRAADMLLVHQIGSVRIGEVVRFTLTYTPSADHIRPTPTELFVKARNTSAIPLRAAYLHGPYTLYTSCYPASFNPNQKYEDYETRGVPQFEPNLKAGGSFNAVISVPERPADLPGPRSSLEVDPYSVTWIIEIASQVIFSTSAAVNFEVLVGRDLKSLELGAGNSTVLSAPGHVRELSKRGSKGPLEKSSGLMKGVYSSAINLVVDDTASLWNTPRFPSWTEKEDLRNLEMAQTDVAREAHEAAESQSIKEQGTQKKQKKVHFVILTHGLHSNLGADMLYLKESIDAASKKAREDARKQRNKARDAQSGPPTDSDHPCLPDSLSEDNTRTGSEEDDEDYDEHVIVRGFPGNAVRTERGIQYLGKRLAKYVLLMTYPDQPYLPVKESHRKYRAFTSHKDSMHPGHASHSGSTIYRQDPKNSDYPYKITSISFIGHSLGGLVQTYAVAYIQKHSPEFFDRIKPINFVALASPFLGLSNENPIYVRFALDFGLVGRTGQDLGLSWTAPTRVRSGWGAMIGGLGNGSSNSHNQPDPKSKPLLRILPTGPAHVVLKKFRNRTVYSNVVNDGIVPLRTSCLLFLDWRGLDRVEKARRENGLVGTMAEWGWAEITGANVNTNSMRSTKPMANAGSGDSEPPRERSGKSTTPISPKIRESELLLAHSDPLEGQGEGLENSPELPKPSQFFNMSDITGSSLGLKLVNHISPPSQGPWASFLSLFRPHGKNNRNTRGTKIYKRSQTVCKDDSPEASWTDRPSESPRSGLVRGDSLYQEENLHAPPKTTFLEAAGDVLKPPIPSADFILDPSTRPRTIFHDRVYHPSDIPPPPRVRNRSFFSSSSVTNLPSPAENPKSPDQPNSPTVKPTSDSFFSSSSGMKVEEKIARAYHKDLSWRKVLVRLEPDAHNNIIVRRMFANAYGWPVVKHLVDTHFANTAAAQTADEFESGAERALPTSYPVSESGKEVIGQFDAPGQASAKKPENNSCEHTLDSSEESNKPQEMPLPSSAATNHTDSADTNNNLTLINPQPPSSSVSRISSFHSRISYQESSRWTDRYFDDNVNSPYDSQDEGYFRCSGIRVTHMTESHVVSDELTESPTKMLGAATLDAKNEPKEAKAETETETETETEETLAGCSSGDFGAKRASEQDQ